MDTLQIKEMILKRLYNYIKNYLKPKPQFPKEYKINWSQENDYGGSKKQ